MIDYYEGLMEDEQKKVSEVLECLYKQTFLLEHIYDKKIKRYIINKMFYQCDKHLEFIKAYFAVMGMEVVENAQLGIIYLRSGQVMGDRLTRLATLYVLVLKLIYDEQMATVSSSVYVVTTLGAIHEKLGVYGLLEKAPSDSKIRETLAVLRRYQVIALPDFMDSLDGYTRIIVYPTVNVILMGDDVRALLKDFGEEGAGEGGSES
ncbi:MAG: DUF4194 domain-containing protein [Lachnospiraceae bacterium]|nr:DUF4194 domain-containing protein [Lachnospiraceae bacterium]